MKKCGMRDSREKGAGMRDQDPLSRPCTKLYIKPRAYKRQMTVIGPSVHRFSKFSLLCFCLIVTCLLVYFLIIITIFWFPVHFPLQGQTRRQVNQVRDILLRDSN